MGKLSNDWLHITIPVFLFTRTGNWVDSNQAGKNLISQFQSTAAWETWVFKEFFQDQERVGSSFFFTYLPLLSGEQKYSVQLFVQKGDSDTYIRIQMIPMLEKISTKKRKKIDWSHFFDSIQDLVYVMDQKRCFLYANQSFLNFLHKKAAEVNDNPIFSVFPQAKGTLIEEKQLEVLDSGKPEHFQYFFPISPFENWFDIQMIPMCQSVFVWIRICPEEFIESESKHSFLDRLLPFYHFFSDPIILFDQQHQLIEANPAFFEVFLLPPKGKLLQKKLWSWFFPEEAKTIQTAIERAFLEEKTSTLQLRTPISRLIKKTFNIHIFPVLDETASPQVVIMHCHDLTEEVQLIKSANEQIESYKNRMDSLLFMLMVISDDWKIEYANQSCKNFFGLQDQDFHQNHLLNVIPEVKDMELGEKIRLALSEKQTILLDGVVLRNRLFDIALFSSSSGIICLFRDETDKKIQQQQKSLLEKYTHFLIENSPDAVLIQNKTGEVVYTNPSYRQKATELQLSNLIKSHQQVRDGNTLWSDFTHTLAQETHFLQLLQFPINHAESSFDGICNVIRDITEALKENTISVEQLGLWLNFIQTIRILLNEQVPFHDWIKQFLIQFAEQVQAKHVWICIMSDEGEWLMLDWKSDSSFRQTVLSEAEAKCFGDKNHCSDLDHENNYALSTEDSLSSIALLIEKEGEKIGWIGLSWETPINYVFVRVIQEATYLISDYQKKCVISEKQCKYQEQYSLIFQQIPVGLVIFDPLGHYETGNEQFQHFFPQPVDFKKMNLWDLHFLNEDQLSLLKMGLMIQTTSESFMKNIEKKLGMKSTCNELCRLNILPILEKERKVFSDHYLLIIQPSLSTSTEQQKFLDNWEQTSEDLQHQLHIIREVLSILTKTSVNKNEAEMAKQMNRNLLRFMRTFRMFLDSTRQKINL
jgi:PAS domain-containing protein